jgi:hypothetical protein
MLGPASLDKLKNFIQHVCLISKYCCPNIPATFLAGYLTSDLYLCHAILLSLESTLFDHELLALLAINARLYY